MKKVNCILLVDDNPGDNYLHSYIIKESGVCSNIKTVYNGVQALSYIRKAADGQMQENLPKPDIIFLDINMPGMDGFEFLQEFSKLDEALKPDTLIFMLTSSGDPVEKRRALDYVHVKDFLNKPLEIETLMEVMEKYF